MCPTRIPATIGANITGIPAYEIQNLTWGQILMTPLKFCALYSRLEFRRRNVFDVWKSKKWLQPTWFWNNLTETIYSSTDRNNKYIPYPCYSLYLEGDSFAFLLLISRSSRTNSSGSFLNNWINCLLEASESPWFVSSSDSLRLPDLELVDFVFNPAIFLYKEHKATRNQKRHFRFLLSLSWKTGSCHALG